MDNLAVTVASARVSSSDLLKARVAIAVAFFNLGLAGGLWAVHIPIIARRLELGEALLGVVLLVLAAGAFVSMLATGWAVGRFGSRQLTAIASILFPFTAAVTILSPSVELLFLAAFIFGAGMGVLDVSMNTQAAEVEAALARPTMSVLHGFYSLGGLAGAGLAAALVAVGLGRGWGAAGVCAAMVVIAWFARIWLLREERPPATGPRLALPDRKLLALGLLTFLSFGLEGAVADWSALFLTEIRDATPAIAGAGYAAFALAMSVMRLSGDWLVNRFGGRALLIVGGALIAIGNAIALAAPEPIVAALGFGLVGVGAANVVPVLFSRGARIATTPAFGIAAVATLGYVGFLSWPPIIGFIADASGLTVALSSVGLAGALILFGGVVLPRPTKPRT
ncbi:MAG: MFS transporter [Bauldia sp.]|nr:MFS transporter [Bauldia sp.]